MKIGKKLTLLRDELGKTRQEVINEIQQQFGRTIGASTLRGYEVDRTEPDFETLETLVKYYKTSIAWLFSETEEELTPKEVNKVILDMVINKLFEEGLIKEGQMFHDYTVEAQNAIIGALNGHVHQVINSSKEKSQG